MPAAPAAPAALFLIQISFSLGKRGGNEWNRMLRALEICCDDPQQLP